jgi:serine/threonine protein kinase
MYECVTRRTPQRGEPIYSLLRNVTEGRHAPPRKLRMDLPADFEAIIERAMSVRPKDRYASVQELGRAVFPLASAEGQRQFNDFYNRTEAEAKWPVSPPRRYQSTGADMPVTVTQPMPREPVPTWQQRTTHTSARPIRRRSRAVPALPARAPASARRRALVYSLALCAVLAVVALVVIGLAVRL